MAGHFLLVLFVLGLAMKPRVQVYIGIRDQLDSKANQMKHMLYKNSPYKKQESKVDGCRLRAKPPSFSISTSIEL